MENKIKEYELKLPSDTNVVTPTNIWKTAIVIANFGKAFTDKELSEAGTPVNEKNLFRILSYMKYLGLVIEKREKMSINNENKTVQCWHQSDNKEVQDFFYYLQDKRELDAKRLFVKKIKNHDMFQSIKNELFVSQKIITEIDLRDHFRRKIPNKSANYYRRGTDFVIRFLATFAGLIEKEGNKLRSLDEKAFVTPGEKNPIGQVDSVSLKYERAEENLGGQFVVKIEGIDGTSFKSVIKKESDIDDTITLIEIIRKKLNK